jgi:hypothetical protein
MIPGEPAALLVERLLDAGHVPEPALRGGACIVGAEALFLQTLALQPEVSLDLLGEILR